MPEDATEAAEAASDAGVEGPLQEDAAQATAPEASTPVDVSLESVDADTAMPSGDQSAEESAGSAAEASEETAVFEEPEEVVFETVAYTSPATIALSEAPNDGAAEVSILQNLVNEALAAVTGTLTGRIQVILSRNTTYEGEVALSAGSRAVADDFVLELSAEDAGDDGMKGEGYTSVAGKVSIMGIRVVMNSVMMALGNAINVVSGGALVYNGTQNANNNLEVIVGKDSSAEINTSKTSDTLTVTAENGAKSVSINAGDGMNTIVGTVNSGDFSVVTGGGSDTVNLELEGSGLGAVYADAGAGIDALTVIDNAQAKSPVTWNEERDESGNVISRTLVGGIYVTSGAGDDSIDVDVRANAGDITFDTGLGLDLIYLFKGDHRTAESIDYSRVYNPYEEINDSATSVVTFVNSDADAVDRLTVDVDASDAIGGIALQGGQGASVHLRGTLAKTDAPIARNAARITLTGEKGNELFIATQQGFGAPAYNFTDALKNKRTVYIHADTSGDITYPSPARRRCPARSPSSPSRTRPTRWWPRAWRSRRNPWM